MKKKKLFLIISTVACVLLIGTVLAVKFIEQPHKHTYGAKTYHISNDEVYYTRTCKNGCVQRYETNATFEDVLTTASAEDSIVLDENITLENEINLQSFVTKDGVPEGLTLNINLDLRGYTINTDVEQATNNSLFMLNANYGKINMNISNGSICSQDLLYIFSFMNRGAEDSIVLNINSLDCEVTGSQATPIFAHNSSSKIKLNANNSSFTSNKSTVTESEFGVGAFINTNSEFNFTNCYFQGGDAIYVKHGTVNLNGCKLVNVGLANRFETTSDKFFAIGSCLATDSYRNSEGQTEFDITVTDCEMVGNESSTMIYVAQTAEAGLAASINTNSSINVVSCSFNNDPVATIVNTGIIHYPNDVEPVNQGNQTWIAG